ncbi:MAG: methylmalonyl-CoA mutase [Deltaproteobacteria bacterium]|nr:MAG: methylmalonyl-CoA mutase [Deltaproteobacteria bacterium]RLC14838.1 MAG: methylmalonyl-CoA mutase [Deltaproteobacteria bacterium]
MRERKIKILIAKPGLDGHDKGAKIVALALRDAGMEVVYTGLHQRVEQIVRTAVQEAVDIIGLSIMSGAHLTICEKLLEMMTREGIESTGVVVGGVIPAHDIAKLEQMGIKGIYPGGTPFDVMVEGIREVCHAA